MVDPDASQATKFGALGALIESILYGGFLVLMIITLVSTFRKTVTIQIVRIHVMGFTMLCLASIHVISNTIHIIRGLGSGDLREQFNDPIFLLKQITTGTQILLGDASWFRLWLRALGLLRKLALIAFRVFCVNLNVKEHIYNSRGVGQTRNILRDFVVLVIESGAIYTTFLLFALVSTTGKSYISTIPYDATIQVVGIVYYLMLFHSTIPRGNPHLQTRDGNTRQENGIELSSLEAPRPVVVHVTKWETRQVETV